MENKIGFIGGGNMASSLIGGLRNAQLNKIDEVVVFEPNQERAAELQSQFSVSLADDNEQLITHCSVVVIAVKPQVLKTILQPLASAALANKPLIISIVAGIQLESIEQWLGGEHAVVRAMPNTPALVAAGATGLYANPQVSEQQRTFAQALLNTVGITSWVDTEQDIDSVTALSGSGPAYFMLFIQSLIDAGVAAGLGPETAKALAVQTATGSAKLIESSDLDIQTLINNVTSPGGTTQSALQSFENDQLTDVVHRAFEAARHRAIELGDELA